MSVDASSTPSGSRSVLFPVGLHANELRLLIDSTLDLWRRSGQAGAWRLPEASEALSTPGYLRQRRLATVFMLGLPGPVEFDLADELALHARAGTDEPDAPDEQGWSEILREILSERDARRRSSYLGPVLWQWCGDEPCGDGWGHATSGDDVLCYSWSPENSGQQIIANFGPSEAYLADGLIGHASSNPYGSRNAHSDNNYLPAGVSVWFYCK